MKINGLKDEIILFFFFLILFNSCNHVNEPICTDNICIYISNDPEVTPEDSVYNDEWDIDRKFPWKIIEVNDTITIYTSFLCGDECGGKYELKLLQNNKFIPQFISFKEVRIELYSNVGFLNYFLVEGNIIIKDYNSIISGRITGQLQREQVLTPVELQFWVKRK